MLFQPRQKVEANDADDERGEREGLAKHACDGKDEPIIDKPACGGDQADGADHGSVLIAVRNGGEHLGHDDKYAFGALPRKNAKNGKKCAEQRDKKGGILLFLDAPLEDKISCDADDRRRRARPRAEEKILHGKEKLVERSEKQDRAVLFELKGRDAGNNAEAADGLYDNVPRSHAVKTKLGDELC